MNEILPNGQVVHLDNLKAPKRDKDPEQSTASETKAPEIEAVGSSKPGADQEIPAAPAATEAQSIVVDDSESKPAEQASQAIETEPQAAHTEADAETSGLKDDIAGKESSAVESSATAEATEVLSKEATAGWQTYAEKHVGLKVGRATLRV